MSAETKFFYTNAIEAAISVYDFTLRFQRKGTVAASVPSTSGTAVTALGAKLSSAVAGGQEVTVQEIESISVGMSPSHAKAMLPSLWQSISAYEQAFGTIPLSPEDKARWDAAFGKKA